MAVTSVILSVHDHNWLGEQGKEYKKQGGTLNTGEITAIQRGPVGNEIIVLQGIFLSILH